MALLVFLTVLAAAGGAEPHDRHPASTVAAGGWSLSTAAASEVQQIPQSASGWLQRRELAYSTCLDVPLKWRSTFGSTCQDYVDNQWCTASGAYGEGWSCWWCTFADFAVSGIGADQACCGCGAGDPEGTFTKSSTTSTSSVTVTVTSTVTTISETSSSSSSRSTTSETSSTSRTSTTNSTTTATSSATSETGTSSSTQTTPTRTTTSETSSSTGSNTTTSESSTSTTSGTTTTQTTTSESSSSTSTASTVTATTTTRTTTTRTTTSETSSSTSTASTVTATTKTRTTTTRTTTSETSSSTSTASTVTATTTTRTSTTPTTTSETSSTSGTTITATTTSTTQTSTTPTTTSESSSTSTTGTTVTQTTTSETTTTATTETVSSTSTISTTSTVSTTATSTTTTATTTTSETSSVTVAKCKIGSTDDDDKVIRFEIIITEVDAKAALTDDVLATGIVTTLAEYVANKTGYDKDKLNISLCDGSLVAIVEVDVLGVEDPYTMLLPLAEEHVPSDIIQLLQGIEGFESLSTGVGNVDAGIMLPTTTATSTTRTNPPLLAIPVDKEVTFDRAVVSGGFQLFLVDGGASALGTVEDATLQDAYEEAILALIPKAQADGIDMEITWNETQGDHLITVMYTFTVTSDDFRDDATELMDQLLAASSEEVAAAFQAPLTPLMPGEAPPEIITASVSIPGVVEELPEEVEVDLAKALAGAIAGAAVMASAGASAAASGASAATSALSGDGGAGASAGGGAGGAAGGMGTGAENNALGGMEGADVDAGVEAEGDLEAEAEGGEEEENEQKAPKMKPVHGNYVSPAGDIFVVGAWSSLPLIGLCYGAHKVMVTHPSTGRQFLLEKGFDQDKNFRDRDGETQLKVHSDSIIECAGIGKLQRQNPWYNGYLVFLAPAILITASLLIILIQYLDAGDFEFSLTPFALMGSACVSLAFIFFVKPGSYLLKMIVWIKNYPPRAIRDEFWKTLGAFMAFMPAIPAFFVGMMTGNILGYIIAGVVSMFGLLAPFGSWVVQYFMTLVKLLTSFSLSGVCLYFSVLDVGNLAVFVPSVLFYLMAVGEWVESKTFDGLPYDDFTEVIADGLDLDGLGAALDLSKAHMNALLILKQGKKLLDKSAQFLLLEGSKIMIIAMVRALIFGVHNFSENFVAHGFGKMQEGMEDKTGDVGQAIANQDTSVSPKTAGRRMLDAMKSFVTDALQPFVSVAKKAKEEMAATIESISEGLSKAQTFIPIDVFHMVKQAKGVRNSAGKVREVAKDLERELDKCPEREVIGEEAIEAYKQSTRVKTMISRLVTEVDNLRHHHDKAAYSSNKSIETGFERINKEVPEMRHETVELLIEMQEACARIAESVDPLDIIYKENAASFARRMAQKNKEVYQDEEEDVLELSFDIPFRKVDSAKFVADLHMEFDRLGADQKQLRTTLREGSTIAKTRGPVTQISGLKATPLNDLEMMGQKARVVPQLREVTDGTCLRAMRATPVYTIFEEKTRVRILDEESHGFIREITEGEHVTASGWPMDINGLFWVPIKPKGAVQLSALEMASPNLELRTISRREAEYYRDQLTLMCAARCPEHLEALPNLLQRYAGHEDRLYAIVCERNGKEPVWYDKAMYPDKSLPIREVSFEGWHGAMARVATAVEEDALPAGGVVLEELQEVTKSVKRIDDLQEQIESSIMGSDNTFIIGEIVLATLAGLAVGGLAIENAEPLMNSVMAMKDLFSAAGEALLELEAVQFVFEMVMEYGEDALDAGMDAIANMTEVFENDVVDEVVAEEARGAEEEVLLPVLIQEGVHGAPPPNAEVAAGAQADPGGAWIHALEEQQDDEAWRASQTSSRTLSTRGRRQATGSCSTKAPRHAAGSPLSRREAVARARESGSSRSILGRRSQSSSGRKSQPLANPVSTDQSPRSQRSQREFDVGELVEAGRDLCHVDTDHPERRSYAIPKGASGAVVAVTEEGVTVIFDERGEVCLLPEDAQQLMQVGKAVKEMKMIAGGFVAGTPPALFFALEQFTMGTLQISLAAIESMILGCLPADLDVPMNNTTVEVEVEEDEEEGSDGEEAKSPRKASTDGGDERHPQDLHSQTLGSANADDSIVSYRRSLGSEVAITESV